MDSELMRKFTGGDMFIVKNAQDIYPPAPPVLLSRRIQDFFVAFDDMMPNFILNEQVKDPKYQRDNYDYDENVMPDLTK